MSTCHGAALSLAWGSWGASLTFFRPPKIKLYRSSNDKNHHANYSKNGWLATVVSARSKILILDDEQGVLSALQRLLRLKKYDVFTTTSHTEALAKLKDENFPLVISDYKMPEITGAEFLEKVKALSPFTTRILLTGYADMDAAIGAINKGYIFRFLTKPWEEKILLQAVEDGMQQHHLYTENERLLELTNQQNLELRKLNEGLEEKVQERTAEVTHLMKQVEASFMGSVRVMAQLSEMYSTRVGGHSKRVARLAGEFAKALNLSSKECLDIQIAGLLHDIGKIGHLSEGPDTVEYALRGSELVRVIPNLENPSKCVRHYQEFYNGSGLPDGLKGDDIPICSQILGLVNAYDNMLYESAHMEEGTPGKALKWIKSRVRVQFSPEIVKSFEKFLVESGKLKAHEFEMQIDLFKLRPNMILSQDICTEAGDLLLSAGYKLDDDVLERIWNRHLESPISDEIYVYRRSIPAAAGEVSDKKKAS